MDVHVKTSKHKVDPTDPEHTDPRHAAAVRKGQRRIERGQFKFESKGEQTDYERRVKSNPGNVMGMPEFFPPLEIKSFGGLPSNCKNGHHRARKCIDGSFCLDCGTDLEEPNVRIE